MIDYTQTGGTFTITLTSTNTAQTQGDYIVYNPTYNIQPVETEEQRLERERLAEQRRLERERAAAAEEARRTALREAERERWRVAEEERREAEARAKAILERHLTVEQKRTWNDGKGYFLVESRNEGKKTGRIYKIDGQLSVLCKDRLHGRSTFCVHFPQGHLIPSADQYLAWKIWLEANERGLLSIANETRMCWNTRHAA